MSDRDDVLRGLEEGAPHVGEFELDLLDHHRRAGRRQPRCPPRLARLLVGLGERKLWNHPRRHEAIASPMVLDARAIDVEVLTKRCADLDAPLGGGACDVTREVEAEDSLIRTQLLREELRRVLPTVHVEPDEAESLFNLFGKHIVDTHRCI